MFWDRLALFINGKAPETQKGYRATLREYLAHLGGNYDLQEGEEKFLRATVLDAARYMRFVQEKKGQAPREHSDHTKAASGTVAYKLRVLSRIYDVLMNSKITEFNPFRDCSFERIRMQKTSKRPTEMIPFEKVDEMIHAPKTLRDRALLAILFGGGLRRGEAAALKISDVKTSATGQVYLRLRTTKAQEEQSQAIPVWASKLVFKLIKERRAANAGDHEPLFVEHWGAPLTPMAVYKVFKHWAAVCNLGTEVSPHSARATAITKLLVDGVEYRRVQQFSRHADLKTVELYDKRRLAIDDSPARKLKFGTD